MTHALAIARREVEERSFVFIAALAVAPIPLLALLFPHMSAPDRHDLVVSIGFIIAVAFTWALGLILGATLVGRELSEKRLSFYFARPITGVSIWFGKLIGASVLLVSSFLIVHALPISLGGKFWPNMMIASRQTVAAGVLAIGFALMLVMHVAATWVRSRSAVLALDFAGIIVLATVIVACVVPLAYAGAVQVAFLLVAFVGASLLVVTVAGGAWQLARGRVDLRRSHVELSRFLWSCAAAVLVIVIALTAWVLTVSPRDLKSDLWAEQNGNILRMNGHARGMFVQFAVDTNSGAWMRENGYASSNGDLVVSIAPTKTLSNAMELLLPPHHSQTSETITVTRLADKPVMVAEVPVGGRVRAAGVSRDGRQIAYIQGDLLAVYDVATKKTSAAMLPITERAGNARTEVLESGVIRVSLPQLQNHRSWILNVYDYDVNARRWTPAMAPQPLVSPYSYRVNGLRVLTAPRAPVEWTMRDGRVALANRALTIRRGSSVERVINLPGAMMMFVAGEIGNGRLLVTTASINRTRTTYIVDANSGAIVSTMKNVAAPPQPFGSTDTEARMHALVHRDTGRIDVIDTQTGAMRPLFD